MIRDLGVAKPEEYHGAGMSTSQAPKTTAKPKAQGVGAAQGFSDFLRQWGLGAAPDLVQGLSSASNAIADKIVPGAKKTQVFAPTMNKYQQRSWQQNPVGNTARDAAGMASWGMGMGASGIGTNIASKVMPKVAAKAIGPVAELAGRGATAGALQETSQTSATPGSVADAAKLGAVINPAMAGVGAVMGRAIPKYLGFRAFGKAGLKLPEVVKAEAKAGAESLKQVRDTLVNKTGATVDRQDVLNIIGDLAKQDQFVGTPGLSGNKQVGGRNVPTGAVANIHKELRESPNLFEFYNRIKNKVDYTANSDRLNNFYKSAAHNVREYIITNSDNPEGVREAMDIYAAQTAMGKGGNKAGSMLGRNLSQVGTGGELGMAAMANFIPGAQPITVPLLVDALLTNKYVGPKIARGLVKTGEKSKETGVGDLLTKLGIMGANKGVNRPTTGQ